MTTLYSVPIGTVSAGDWIPIGAATLHEAVDETVAALDINDHIETDTTVACELSLLALPDPQSSSGHVLTWVTTLESVAFDVLPCRISLYQGATLVAQSDFDSDPSFPQTISYTLSGPEADAITDYADLRVRLQALATPASVGALLQVIHAVELAIPQALGLRVSTEAVLARAGATAVPDALAGATLEAASGQPGVAALHQALAGSSCEAAQGIPGGGLEATA